MVAATLLGVACAGTHDAAAPTSAAPVTEVTEAGSEGSTSTTPAGDPSSHTTKPNETTTVLDPLTAEEVLAAPELVGRTVRVQGSLIVNQDGSIHLCFLIEDGVRPSCSPGSRIELRGPVPFDELDLREEVRGVERYDADLIVALDTATTATFLQTA